MSNLNELINNGILKYADKKRIRIEIEITGRIQTGNYTNKDGVKVYTTDIMVESFGFAESKQNGNSGGQSQQADSSFVNVPDTDMEELPFS